MSFLIAFLLLPCILISMVANAGANGLSRFCFAGLVVVFAWDAVAALGAPWGTAVTIVLFGGALPVGAFLVYLAGTLLAIAVAARQFPDDPWETIGAAGLLDEFFKVYRGYLEHFVPAAPSRS